MSGMTKAPLIVVQPALNRPATPAADMADLMTAPQNGDTASDQSAVRMSYYATHLISSLDLNFI